MSNGEGFGNQSYLMVHLLTLATCWFKILQKTTFLPFLIIFANWRCVLYMFTEFYLLAQICRCSSIMKPRQQNDAKFSTQFICTMISVLSQMYNCGLAILPRQSNSSTIGAWFLYNWIYIFEDQHNFPNIQVWSWSETTTTSTIGTWLILIY